MKRKERPESPGYDSVDNARPSEALSDSQVLQQLLQGPLKTEKVSLNFFSRSQKRTMYLKYVS